MNKQFRKTNFSNTTRKRKLAIMSDQFHLPGSEFIEKCTLDRGNTVPIYEVYTYHAFNQLIGYAKFINQSYGNVYYRGEAKLHKSLIPSLFRQSANISKSSEQINKIVEEIMLDDRLMHTLKLSNSEKSSIKQKSCRYIIEGMLQHYGIPTRFIDIVDNHWIALWMGLHRIKTNKQICNYYHYEKRILTPYDFINKSSIAENDVYQYILLIAIPHYTTKTLNGTYISQDYANVDLRQALPSYFLRPHAQHGMIIRKITKGHLKEDFDLSESIVGILKIRIDRANDWLGSGALATQDNLFPPPAYDQGYDILLSRNDIFDKYNVQILRYI